MTATRMPLVIIVKPEGLWDRQQSRDHFAGLRKELVRQRATHGRARVLVDLASMPVQQQDTISSMRIDLAASYLPGDKVALVTTSALLGMQVRRVDLPAQTRLFDDDAEAMVWLQEA